MRIFSFHFFYRFVAALRPYLLVGVIPLMVLAERFIHVRQEITQEQLVTWLQSDLAGQPVVFILTYAVVSVTFLSNIPLILAGGALYGPVWGGMYMLSGSLLAAVLTFLAARHLGRAGLEQWLNQRVSTAAYGDWLDKAGFRSVVMLRLLPIFPFSVLNVAFGLTRVSWINYVLGTVIGMLPSTLLLAWMGDRLVGLNALTGTLLTLLTAGVTVAYLIHKRHDARRKLLSGRILLVGLGQRSQAEV